MSKFRAELPLVAKKVLWNIKYGLLGYPQLEAPADAVSYLSALLGQSGELLELGCGRGSLVRGLRRAGWKGYYCGVDISAKAIDDARKLADQHSSWVVSDVESFQSSFQWNAIVMIESIYYVRLDMVPNLLHRLATMLSEGGILLVRLHDVVEHKEYVKMIHGLFADTEWVGTNLLRLALPISADVRRG